MEGVSVLCDGLCGGVGSDPEDQLSKWAWEEKGKDSINEAGCESHVACFQELCSSCSNWVFEHPGSV